jgi:hypothetical protein
MISSNGERSTPTLFPSLPLLPKQQTGMARLAAIALAAHLVNAAVSKQ